MEDSRKKTLKQLLTEIGNYGYDHGDYTVIHDTVKEVEVQKFVEAYLPGTEILKNGKDGAPVTIHGMVGETKGATGEEELFCHDYLVYDMTGSTGEWVIATFPSLEKVEQHILGEGGYLNVFCTDMLVMKDGVIQPFEVLFQGDDGEPLVLDKDIFDENFDLKAMQNRLSVQWVTEEE